MTRYDESNIQVYSGLEGLRKKPQMYIGPTNSHGIWILLKEAVDNAVDEFTAGRNKFCHVIQDTDVIYVVDGGSGIPVGKIKDSTGKTASALEFIVSSHHAGGKFDDVAYTHAIGCFVGSTRIKLLDGTMPTIADLHRQWTEDHQKFWVYAFDTDGETAFTPRRCYGVYLTKYVKELAVVTLDNGEKVECTVDHPFLTWDGDYVEAQNLQPGDSLRGLHTRYDRDGYETHSGRWKKARKPSVRSSHMYRTHGTVWNLLGKVSNKGKHIHHKNGIKTDNRPSNLEVLTRSDHFWKDYNDNGRHTLFVNKNKRLRKISASNMARVNSREDITNIVIQGKIVQCAARALRDYGKLTRETYSASRGWCYPTVDTAKFYYSKQQLLIQAKRYLKIYGKSGRQDNGGFGLDYTLLSDYAHKPADNFMNHKVIGVRIKRVKIPVPVYGMSVEVDHNYLLGAGVFVKNTHGIGIKAVNALSDYFQVWTKRNNIWWTTQYSKGVKKQDVIKVKSPPKLPFNVKIANAGTIVAFKPDPTIFSKGSKLPIKLLLEWAELTAHINGGLKIYYTSKDARKEWYYPKGIAEYLTKRIQKLKAEGVGKALVVNEPNLDLAFQFTNYDGEALESYTNSSLNVDGGVHVQALWTALAKAIKPYAGRNNFNPIDLRDGVVGLINYKISSPQFSSQTKEKLVDDRVKRPCEETLSKAFEIFFKKNKTLAQNICKRASELRSLREEVIANKKAVMALKDTRKSNKGILPGKLSDAVNCKPEERELFLVEGDSAGGTAKRARYNKFQAVLPLKGKIMNVMKEAKQDRIFSSEEVIGVLRAIGYNPSNKQPLDKLRIGKLILLSDPDPDGFHINVLLLTLIARFLPGMFDRGLVYVVAAPKYVLKYKEKNYFSNSVEGMRKVAPKGAPLQNMSYIKGWGEINAEALREIAFDVGTRQLLRITGPSRKDMLEFNKLMSDNVDYRRELLGI